MANRCDVAMSQRHPRRPFGFLPRSARDPDSAAERLGRLDVLAHELSGLLDGSMRCLGLAIRSISAVEEAAQELVDAQTQIEAARRSLERMSELVEAAMNGSAASIGAVLTGASRPVSLGEAVRHAIDVVRPVASANQTSVDWTAPDEVDDVLAGPLYVVMLNGLRNAVESVARAGERGSVRMRLHLQQKVAQRWIVIEIEDDGQGLPSGVLPASLFEPGASTKPRGGGLGLALIRQVVADLGGFVELTNGDGPAQRKGALLRVVCPLVESQGDRLIGG